MEVIKKGKLPSSWSAQCCELYALRRGLEYLTQKKGTIYTDSKYAFGVVHTFGKMWEERGLLNAKGKGLICEGLGNFGSPKRTGRNINGACKRTSKGNHLGDKRKQSSR